MCILSNTNESGAMHVAERIRNAIAACKHKIADNIEIAVTVSLGCATFSSSRSFANAFELLQEADRCQYAAKCGGRNKVVSSNPNVRSLFGSRVPDPAATGKVSRITRRVNNLWPRQCWRWPPSASSSSNWRGPSLPN